MNKKRILSMILIVTLCCCTLLSGGCAQKQEKVTILVAAAASLKNVMDEKIIPGFQMKYSNIEVEATYESSGKLQTQIEEGLQADVFISAANKQMDELVAKNLIDRESVVDLLENMLVLIVPSGSTADIITFGDIVKADAIAIGDPASVPAGQYAKQVLEELGIYEEIAAKASFGTNVTEVLNQVAEGSAGAGIVYETDAASKPDKVTVVAQAPENAPVIIYPAGIIKESNNANEAALFIEYLQGNDAMKAFESVGFKKH